MYSYGRDTEHAAPVQMKSGVSEADTGQLPLPAPPAVSFGGKVGGGDSPLSHWAADGGGQRAEAPDKLAGGESGAGLLACQDGVVCDADIASMTPNEYLGHVYYPLYLARAKEELKAARKHRPKAEPLTEAQFRQVYAAVEELQGDVKSSSNAALKRSATRLQSWLSKGLILQDLGMEDSGVQAETAADGTSTNWTPGSPEDGNIYLNPNSELLPADWQIDQAKKKAAFYEKNPAKDKTGTGRADQEAIADPEMRRLWLKSVLMHEEHHTEESLTIGFGAEGARSARETEAYKHHVRYLLQMWEQAKGDPVKQKKIEVLLERARSMAAENFVDRNKLTKERL